MLNEGAYNPDDMSIAVEDRIWDVSDYGKVNSYNAVWTYCEQLPTRDQMRLGQTQYLRFRASGPSTVKVVRVQ